MKKIFSLFPFVVLAIIGLGIYSLTCRQAECPIVSEYLGADLSHRQLIKVYKPEAFATVSDGIKVKGRSRIKHNYVNYRIEDNNQQLLAADYLLIRPSMLGEWHDFTHDISLARLPTASGGIMEIFYKSGHDGSVNAIVIVPLRFE